MTATQIAEIQPQQVAVMQEPQNISGSMLTMIATAASNPNVDVDKMQALLDMQMKMMDRQGEIEFSQAMARLNFPVIHHKAAIKHGGKLISTYARYEDIDAIIRPIYSAQGFSVSFNSRKNENGTITYTGRLSHAGGFSQTAEMDLPADSSGAKNAIQALGSTISYAKRYLVSMLLNITTTGDDDDGEGATETVDTEQAATIDTLIRASKTDRPKFLHYMGVADVRDIRAADYAKAINALNAKQKKAEEEAKKAATA